MQIKVEIKGLRELKSNLRRYPQIATPLLNTAIKKSIYTLRGNAIKETPVDTSRLRGSYRERFGNLRGELTPTAKYAVFVHEGTKAHTIRPKSRKALYWKGARHPVRSVRHPGTRANPYLQRAVDKSRGQVDRHFVEALDKTLKEIARI